LLRVDVCILKAREQHAAMQIDDFGPPADQRPDVIRAANRGDPALPYGHRLRRPAGRAGPIDPSSNENQIRIATRHAGMLRRITTKAASTHPLA
jgi:hypothetical protein